jgi:PII-like signaling protein
MGPEGTSVVALVIEQYQTNTTMRTTTVYRSVYSFDFEHKIAKINVFITRH